MLVSCHQRDQPELREVFRRQGCNHVLGPGIPPRASPIYAGFPRALGIEPLCTQLRFPRFRPLPLPPDDAAHPPPHPCVKLFDRPPTLGQAEVIHPAPQYRIERFDQPRQ